jgi:hypothetical protein
MVGKRQLIRADDKHALASGQCSAAFQKGIALPLVLAGIVQRHVGGCGALNAFLPMPLPLIRSRLGVRPRAGLSVVTLFLRG